MAPARDVRVAPGIFRTPTGWRVYVRRGGQRCSFRLKAATTLEELQTFVETFTAESERLRLLAREAEIVRRGTFAADAKTYLALKVVVAMPSYTDRQREIGRWVKVFGRRARSTLTAREIDEQLQAWRDAGAGASSVNKYRTALMSLYTRLDGRGAANPVRDTHVFEEPAATPRGLPYDLVRRLLEAMPRTRSRPVKGVKGSRALGSRTRVRFELMAWTGMTPRQIGELTPEHINVPEGWYVSPQRHKGARRPRHPRPLVKKPMTTDAKEAFTRFVALKAWGRFSTSSLRHSLACAHATVEAALQKERGEPRYVLPAIRPYDFRHSFGTELYRQTQNLSLVAEMLDQTSTQMTRRYALGAVSDVLAVGMRQFEAATAPARDGLSPGPTPSPGVPKRSQASPSVTDSDPAL